MKEVIKMSRPYSSFNAAQLSSRHKQPIISYSNRIRFPYQSAVPLKQTSRVVSHRVFPILIKPTTNYFVTSRKLCECGNDCPFGDCGW